MKIVFRYRFLIMTVFLLLSACINNSNKNEDISGLWDINQVLYESGGSRQLGEGNQVEISEDNIVEIIKGYGTRSYRYKRKQSTLTLIAGDEPVIWEILELNSKVLKVETPIGVYFLSK